jgi:hypothetical protein
VLCLEQFLAAGKCPVEPFRSDINQGTEAFGVVNAPGNVANLMAYLKARLRRCGVFAQIRSMDFKPQAFGTLAVGQQFGF